MFADPPEEPRCPGCKPGAGPARIVGSAAGSPRAGYCSPMVMWASDSKGARVREGLTLLLSQGVIDDFELRHEDELPYRVTLPAGVVSLDEHQAAHFVLGAVVARFGPLSRDGREV